MQATLRFRDHELDDILMLTGQVFDEEEAGIPIGVEDLQLEKVPAKMKFAKRKGLRRRPVGH